MKIFSWVHNRLLNGGGGGGSPHHHQTKQRHSSPTNYSISISDDHIRIQEQQGETHDCHSSSPFFLSIGTLGNKCPLASSDALIHPDDNNKYNDTSYNLDNENNDDDDNNDDDKNDLSNFTLEEVGQLQKELKKLLKRKSSSKIYHHLSSDEFVNFPSSILEVDHIISNKHGGGENEEEALDRTIKRIIDRCKDVCKESKKGTSIGKRSVSFLVKKMFMCTNGFRPSPRSFRDNAPFEESTLMDKLLRTMLSQKIHPQSSSPSPSSIKKRLEEKPSSNSESQEEETKNESGSKWVKTDSEYIVLEI